MISYFVDVVLLVALLLTSLRVTSMHRDLRRLRGYQADYMKALDETSRAVESIHSAIRHIGGEGREALERLEAAIGRAGALSKKLETIALAGARKAPAAASQAGSTNEILMFPSDSRQPQGRVADAAVSADVPRPQQSDRDARVAQAFQRVRAAGASH